MRFTVSKGLLWETEALPTLVARQSGNHQAGRVILGGDFFCQHKNADYARAVVE